MRIFAAMIDKSIVEKVIETSNARIVDVVSDFVSLKKRGSNYVGLCPFHSEKTGSFSVSPGKGFFKCFGCGKAGSALTFVMEHEHLTFVEGLKYLGRKFGIEVNDVVETPEMQLARSERESIMVVMDFARQHFIDNLWNTQDGQAVALPYFRHRGFRDDIIRKFQLGYSMPGRRTFTDLALSKGYKIEYCAKAGLTILGDNGYRADRFFGRVMFPIHSISGKVIAFGGRVMQTGEKIAKYINSPETELYHKSDIVYGIYQAKNEIIKKDRCYLVEGYTDVISMHQAGIVNVVASSGTSLTTNQIRLIQRFTNNITVLYDGDNAGIKASLRGIDMILAQGMNVKVLLLPDGEDPDSFARSHSADEYVAYIDQHQTDFIEFKTSLLMGDVQSDPLKKSTLVNDIVASIAVVSDKILRTIYIKKCSQMLEVDEQTLFSVLEDKLVNDAVHRRQEQVKQQNKQQEHDARLQAELSIAQADAADAGNPPMPPVSDDMQREVAQVLSRQKNPYANEERELLRLFVTYVSDKLFVGRDEETTVGEFIVKQLAEDDLQSVDARFNAMMQAYIDAPDRTTLKSEYFINLPDPQLNAFAADLLGNKYELSVIHERNGTVQPENEMLDYLVVRAVDCIRMKKVMLIIDDLTRRLKESEQQQIPEDEANKILEDLTLWNDVKKQLSKNLGERTVI